MRDIREALDQMAADKVRMGPLPMPEEFLYRGIGADIRTERRARLETSLSRAMSLAWDEEAEAEANR